MPAATDKSATGNVVSKNSPRSLVKPRSAIAATGAEAVKVRVAFRRLAPPLNGGSFRNAAIWPLAAIIAEPGAKFTPSRSVK